MTEDEAKTKWCPWARWSDGSNRAFEHGNSVLDVNYSRVHVDTWNACIGSACIAWRCGTGAGFEDTGRCGLVPG